MKQEVINRLHYIKGQVEGIERMKQEGLIDHEENSY